jgi:pimeloyl-ACP methyl ester carboxylesterase
MPLDRFYSETERALVFGAEDNLVATLTLPAAGTHNARYAVLLTNVGIMPRCGPYRLNVEIARRLAQSGIPSLRFDLSGLGDSSRPLNALPTQQQWVLDTRAAMDELERRLGVRQFVMIGVCSGADVAFYTAALDRRLRGVVLFDPYLYPTRRTAILGVVHRLRSLGLLATLRSLHGRFARLLRQHLHAGTEAPAAEDKTLRHGPGAPTLDEFAGRIGTIVDGGAHVLLLYSGSYPYLYNYEQQAADNLRPYGLQDKVEFGFIPDADHVLMGMDGRQRMIERCMDFTARWFVTRTKASNTIY